MNPLKTLARLTALLLSLAAGSASAALLQYDSNGKLTGAKGLVVGSQKYDVAFQEGSCIVLFSGCDADSDLPFIGGSAGGAAMSTLFDALLEGGVSPDPTAIFGCEDVNQCVIETPYFVTNNGGFNSATIFTTSTFMSVTTGGGAVFEDSTVRGSRVFAVWTAIPDEGSQVPEPSVLALASLGLAATLMSRRRPSRALPA